MRSSTSESLPLLDNALNPYTILWTPSSLLFPSTPVFSRPVLFILITKMLESLAFYGISGNLILFVTEPCQLNLSPTTALVVAYLFKGTWQLSCVLSGWLGDALSGKFSIIVCGALVYLVGTILVLLGSISQADSHVSFAVTSLTTDITFKRAIYLTGLVLVALGSGAITPNVSPFGVDQLADRIPEAIEAFFRWFYWFISIGALVAFSFVAYVQQEISYFYGYLILLFSVILALIIFVAGKKSYHIRGTVDNVLSTMLKISWEALKNSRRNAFRGGSRRHWLDRAKRGLGGSYRSWQVDEVKMVYRLIPIFCCMVLYWTIYFQMDTSMTYQGQHMDSNVTPTFRIPVASVNIFYIVSVLVLIPVMSKLVYPLLRKFNIQLDRLQRIGIGMIIASASMVCAGGLELYRIYQCCQTRDSYTANNTAITVSNITIFYQAPQYFLIGLGDVFTVVTGYELTYAEAPRCMQAAVMAIFFLTESLGSYSGAVLVAIVNAITGSQNSKNKRFPDPDFINNGKLAYYFFLLAGLMVLNVIIYIFVALNFKAKKKAAERNLDEDLHSTTQLNESEAPPSEPTSQINYESYWVT